MDNEIILNPLQISRAVRLSETTRRLASEYLSGKYQSRIQPCGFSYAGAGYPENLDVCDLPEGLRTETVHGRLTLLNAQKCRIFILPEELLAGSAPNLDACHHRIPGTHEKVFSISHTTVDLADAIRLGLSGLEKEILDRRDKADRNQICFYNGLLDVLKAMRIWVKRHIEEYEKLIQSSADENQTANMRRIVATLQNVPENPPCSFREAVQSLWTFWEFQRLCGNWSGLGRLDEFLWPYLKADLENGQITLDEAREYLAHFWIKGTEWCYGLRENSAFAPGSGDAQNYQNVILGGIDENGEQVENEITFLILDIVEELHISDYPVTVRLNDRTSEHLLRRIAEVQLLGGGIVSVYNEPVILAGLRKLGFSEREARRFTNDGCWEVIIPGQTNFGYIPFDTLEPLQKTLFEADELPGTYEELYARLLKNFEAQSEKIREYVNQRLLPGKDPGNPKSYPDSQAFADVVLSLLMPSCRANGCSYSLDGTTYCLLGLHMMGLPDVANSLYAIRKLVFEKQVVTLPELVDILRHDWQGQEALRQQFANSLRYYGNDNPECDRVLKQLYADGAGIYWKLGKIGNVQTVPGVSTFGREIEYARNRLATAFGKHAHEYLAPNLSPTPGTDKSPITAVLKSYCTMDFTNTPNGCPLDLRLSAGINKLPNAPDILAQILRVFVSKGGMYMQIDTVDPEMLREAQKYPDRFPNLVVRISGWSARFASLDKKWQDMIINRTAMTSIA